MAQIISPVTAGRSGATDAASAEPAQANGNELLRNLKPLVVDIAVPTGSYYLLHKGLGVDLVTSLALSSVVPAVRTVVDAVHDRVFNGLAGLMLLVNGAGI